MKISRRTFLTGGSAALLSAAGLGAYSYGPGRHHVETLEHDVYIPDLPAAFHGMRVAQISDLHFGPYREADILATAVEQINQLAPQMVFITGDFITFNHDDDGANHRDINASQDLLRSLRAPVKYATLGNHDTAVSDYLKAQLASSGIKLLKNEREPIEVQGDRLWIAGMDDVMFGFPDPKVTLPRWKEGEPVLTLGHEPDYADDMVRAIAEEGLRADLYLAGHTHGGQINIRGLRRLALPWYGMKYVHGPFQIQNMLLYVNRGLGTVHLPLRFNARPEVTLFTLRNKA